MTKPDDRQRYEEDPTANVIALNEAANKRQDDLRVAAKELSDAKIAHQKEISDLRAEFQRELRKAEAERLDSIRQVDREDVNKTAAMAQTAIATLAATTSTVAETLRTGQANLAAAAESRQTAFANEVNKRLSMVELAQSEGTGKGTGAKNLWAIMAVGTGLLITLLMAALTVGGVVVGIAYAIRGG